MTTAANAHHLPIGTVVMMNDGFARHLGEIIKHDENRWGKFTVIVMANGKTECANSIAPEGTLGIGWTVASPEWIARLAE